MAEDIGKVVVSIEAEVVELRKGLERAESMFKESSAKIVAEQQGLGIAIGKSWTELSMKINVLQVVLGAVEKGIGGLGSALSVLNDETLNTSDSIGGFIEEIGNAGIPVVSEMVGIAIALADAFSGAARERAELAEFNKRFSEMEEWRAARQAVEDYKGSLEDTLLVQQFMTLAVKQRSKDESDVTEQFQIQRAAIEQIFAKQNKMQDEAMENSRLTDKQKYDAIWERSILQNEILDQLDMREQLAHEQWKKFQDEKAAADKKFAEEKAKRDEEDAKKLASREMSLAERLAIMKAKEAGKTAEAEVIAIQSKYRKMLEGATTETQKNLIREMQELELSGVGADGGGTGGGTTSVSTAVGGFTVAMGASEPKKQTSLLQKIADSNQLVADTLTKAQASEGIIVAA